MAAHVSSVRTYVLVFGALMVLTALTVGAALVDLGEHWNDVVALAIAVTKALLVLLFFMHLKDSQRLTWLAVGIGVLWLVVLIGFTMSDVLTRHLPGLGV